MGMKNPSQMKIVSILLINFTFISTLLFADTTPFYSEYSGQVVDTSGKIMTNAFIEVTKSDSPKTLSELYSDGKGSSPLSNPLKVDSQGKYQFFVLDGTYNIRLISPTINMSWVQVPIINPEHGHTLTNSDANAPLTLIESSTPKTSGNGALRIERKRSDNSRVYAPWTLFVNEGPTNLKRDVRWMYNVDWNELSQGSGPFFENDLALSFNLKLNNNCIHDCNNFSYDYAPKGLAGETPKWINLVRQEKSRFVINNGPLVVSDGLKNSSLVAKRVGWTYFFQPAPSGLIQYVVYEVTPTNPAIFPGEIVTTIPNRYSNRMATLTYKEAQDNASVFFNGGNSVGATTLTMGKALARIAKGVVVKIGDTLVSSGAEPGRLKVNNQITDTRKVVGYAIENSNATLPGYVALVRVSQ